MSQRTEELYNSIRHDYHRMSYGSSTFQNNRDEYNEVAENPQIYGNKKSYETQTKNIPIKHNSSINNNALVIIAICVIGVFCISLFFWKKRKRNLQSSGKQIKEGGFMICKECGAEIPENMKFCGQCGVKIERPPIICKHCGAEMPASMVFCGQCGAKIEEDIPIIPVQETPSAQEATFPQKDIIAQPQVSDAMNEHIVKHKENTTILPIQETPTVQESSPPQTASAKQTVAVDTKEKEITNHEEATRAPLISVSGLFSTRGRRNRLSYFKMILLQIILCLILNIIFPLTGYFLTLWFGITNLFKRSHDLNKSTAIGIIISIFATIYTIIATFVNFYVANIDPLILLRNKALAYLYFGGSFISIIIGVYLLFAPGTKGINQYGRSPEELKHDPQ